MKIGDALYDVLKDANLKVIDIGARGGSMKQLALLAPFTHYYAFEANDEEAEALKSTFKKDNLWGNFTVIPKAVLSKEGMATLYITKQPGLSSMLKPNYAVIDKYYDNPDFRIESKINVPTISLDRAAELYEFQDACFLKVDTQGTELDILKSGKKILKDSVLAVYVEVEFQPFYMKQPLFSDVDVYLRELGFSMFDLHRALLRRGTDQKDFYSRRQVVWAHALYMKEPDSILRDNIEKANMDIKRLLCLALAHEHFDLALELVTSGKGADMLLNLYGNQIKKDVVAFIQDQTIAIFDKYNGDNIPNFTTSFYKDRNYIYQHQHHKLLNKYRLLSNKYKDINHNYNDISNKYEDIKQKIEVRIGRHLRRLFS